MEKVNVYKFIDADKKSVLIASTDMASACLTMKEIDEHFEYVRVITRDKDVYIRPDLFIQEPDFEE